jgi:hypothetical protein
MENEGSGSADVYLVGFDLDKLTGFLVEYDDVTKLGSIALPLPLSFLGSDPI